VKDWMPIRTVDVIAIGLAQEPAHGVGGSDPQRKTREEARQTPPESSDAKLDPGDVAIAFLS